VCLAEKTHPRNDLLCVERDVKLYSLTHYATVDFEMTIAILATLKISE